jgi:hypothetical protein
MYKLRFLLISYILILFLLSKLDAKNIRSNQNSKIIEKIEHPLSYDYKKYNLNKCNSESCVQGSCINHNIWKCNEGYYVIESDTGCTYSNRSKYISAVLDLFFPGLGHIYSLRILFGFMKLLLAILMINILRYIFNSKKSNYDLFLKTFFTINIISLHLYDISRFLLDYYTDGYGIPLESYDLNIFF